MAEYIRTRVGPGVVVFENIPIGSYNLEVEALGYKTVSMTATVLENQTVRVTVVMEEVIGIIGDFSGAVDKQSASGETVTITVTLPDASTSVLTALTEVDGSYSKEYTATKPGTYKAVAEIGEDELYLSAKSDGVQFSVGKEPRTITLQWIPK